MIALDVYVFAYAQTVAVDAVPERAGLLQDVQALQRRGYRQFVEDYPDSPVTKLAHSA